MDRQWKVIRGAHVHDSLVGDYDDTPKRDCYCSMATLQFQLAPDSRGIALLASSKMNITFDILNPPQNAYIAKCLW